MWFYRYTSGLYHYGVKGMKWGVRKTPVRLGLRTTKLKDVPIYRSVGAKSKNYDIFDPSSGEYFRFSEGTRITNSEVFAGKGVPFANYTKRLLLVFLNKSAEPLRNGNIAKEKGSSIIMARSVRQRFIGSRKKP